MSMSQNYEELKELILKELSEDEKIKALINADFIKLLDLLLEKVKGVEIKKGEFKMDFYSYDLMQKEEWQDSRKFKGVMIKFSPAVDCFIKNILRSFARFKYEDRYIVRGIVAGYDEGSDKPMLAFYVDHIKYTEYGRVYRENWYRERNFERLFNELSNEDTWCF